MKTIILVWINESNNLKQDNYNHFWGLGDMIRGAIHMHQLSKKMNFHLIVDIQKHTLSNYLKQETHLYSSMIQNAKIDFVSNPEEYIIHDPSDVIYFFTNAKCDMNITDDTKLFIKNILTPNAEFKTYLNTFKTPTEYSILHYRLGDEELVRNNRMNMIEYISHFKKHKESSDILLSDSKLFKSLVKNEIFSFQTSPVHLGHSKEIDTIKDTLAEFFIVSGSKKIKTFTVYGHVSGFVQWTSILYNIPLIRL